MAKAKLSSTKNSKKDIELIQSKFENEGYICNNQIATAIFLSQFGQIGKKDGNQEIEQMVERILRNEEERKTKDE